MLPPGCSNRCGAWASNSNGDSSSIASRSNGSTSLAYYNAIQRERVKAAAMPGDRRTVIQEPCTARYRGPARAACTAVSDGRVATSAQRLRPHPTAVHRPWSPPAGSVGYLVGELPARVLCTAVRRATPWASVKNQATSDTAVPWTGPDALGTAVGQPAPSASVKNQPTSDTAVLATRSRVQLSGVGGRGDPRTRGSRSSSVPRCRMAKSQRRRKDFRLTTPRYTSGSGRAPFEERGHCLRDGAEISAGSPSGSAG